MNWYKKAVMMEFKPYPPELMRYNEEFMPYVDYSDSKNATLVAKELSDQFKTQIHNLILEMNKRHHSKEDIEQLLRQMSQMILSDINECIEKI